MVLLLPSTWTPLECFQLKNKTVGVIDTQAHKSVEIQISLRKWE